MFGQMTRWVDRKGTTVRFGNVVGGFGGRAYVYEFPDEKLAGQFEREIADEDGTPRPVDEKWKPYAKGQE